MHSGKRGVEQARFLQFTQDRHDPTRAVNVLHMHIALGRSDFRKARHAAAQPVDVFHREIYASFMRGGQQM